MEVGLHQPGFAILIVFEKFLIAGRFHFVSPHDLGVDQCQGRYKPIHSSGYGLPHIGPQQAAGQEGFPIPCSNLPAMFRIGSRRPQGNSMLI